MKTFNFIFLFLGFSFLIYAQPCHPPCYKVLSSTGTNDAFQQTAVLPNGEIVSIGKLRDSSALVFFSKDLMLKEVFTFDFTSNSDFFSDFLTDSEGMLFITGRDNPTGDTENFLFRFDPLNKQVLWSKKLTIPAYTRIEFVKEIEPGGNYLIGGTMVPSGDCDGFIMEINRANGEMEWIRQFNVGNCEIIQDVVIHDGFIYAAGTYRYYGGLGSIRASITKFDMNGAQIWNRYYFTDALATARTYMECLFIEDDHIYATFRGDFQGSSFTNAIFGMMKTDLDGAPVWAKTYTFNEGDNEFARTMVSTDEGFAISGRFTRFADATSDIYLMRTDKEGEIISTRTFNESLNFGNFQINDGKVYIPSSTTQTDINGNTDLLMVSLNLDETIDDTPCDEIETFDVSSQDMASPILSVLQPMVEVTPSLSMENFDITGTKTIVEEFVFCADLVDVEELEALSGQFEVNIHPNPAIDYIQIESEGEYEQVLIFDLNGKRLMEGTKSARINISSLPVGVLFLQFLDKENNPLGIQKVVKAGYPRP